MQLGGASLESFQACQNVSKLPHLDDGPILPNNDSRQAGVVESRAQITQSGELIGLTMQDHQKS